VQTTIKRFKQMSSRATLSAEVSLAPDSASWLSVGIADGAGVLMGLPLRGPANRGN
jgi:hypothetical protein